MELNIKVLVENKLTPNSYVYLYYLVHKMLCPIKLPQVNLTRLQEMGFIKLEDSGKITARAKAIKLVEEEEYKYSEEPANRVEEWIEDWRNLFPSGIKTGSYYVKGSPQGCLKKMKKFVKENKKITKKQIFKATEKYIEESRIRNFHYMKLADYFIYKDGMSMLYAYVEQLDAEPEHDVHANNMTDDI